MIVDLCRSFRVSNGMRQALKHAAAIHPPIHLAIYMGVHHPVATG